MRTVLIICVVLFITFLCPSANGYKILGVFSTNIKSHYIVGSALMKGLAEKGHDVTVISPFPLKTPIKNWKDVSNTKSLDVKKGLTSNLLNMQNQRLIQRLAHVFNIGILSTNMTLSDPVVQNLINSNEKFDLVITEIFLNEAMLGFGQRFNVPVVALSTFGASSWTCDLVGSPSPPSYVPLPFLSFSDHMTLVERIENLALTIFERIYREFMYLPQQEKLYNQYFPDPKPSFKEVRKNVSLVLLNSHVSISFPRPYVPNMIEVGGMHVNRNSKPLPADIKNFIESAKDGVIYFSMGSNLKSNSLPKEKLSIILNTFKSLKQKVLWKWENKVLPDKPDNVFISDWFPQDDILAHPNVRAFITHGGLLSTTEAIYHGVPIIGIPIFGDQFLNMAKAVKSGFGLQINYNTLNQSTFEATILEMVNNPRYSENIKEISKRYRDQPLKPLDKAVYWIEYVIRHKGASHLHSAGQDLSFIEYHNIDAWLILIGGLALIIYLFVAMIRKLINLAYSKSNKRQEKQSQKKKKQK